MKEIKKYGKNVTSQGYERDCAEEIKESKVLKNIWIIGFILLFTLCFINLIIQVPIKYNKQVATIQKRNYLVSGRLTEKESAEMAERVIKKISSIGENATLVGLTDEAVKNYLIKFIEAELVTTYPDLSDGKTDEYKGGNVRFFRNGTERMTYMEYDEFMKYVNSSTREDFERIKNRFTTDPSNSHSVIVAYYTFHKVEYSDGSVGEYSYVISTKNLDLYAALSDYQMPFELPFILMLSLKSGEFAEHVADIALDSKISIGVFDDEEKTVTVEYIVVGTDEDAYTITKTTTDDRMTSQIEPIEVGGWIAELQAEYENRVDNQTDGNTTIYRNTWYQKSYKKISRENYFLGLIKNTKGKIPGFVEKDGKLRWSDEYNPNGVYVKYIPNIFDEKFYPSIVNTHTEEEIENLRELIDLPGNKEWICHYLAAFNNTANIEPVMRYLISVMTGVKDPKAKSVEEFMNGFGKTAFSEIGNSSDIDSGAVGSVGAGYSSIKITPEDLQMLYKITYAERGDGTQKQQEYVVSVILNRVLCSGFPNTIKGVIFAPMQFQPTRNGAYERAKPTATTIAAVNNVIKNGDTAQGAVYFMTVAASKTQSWLSECKFLFNDGNGSANTHNFYTKTKYQQELSKFKQADVQTSSTGTVVPPSNRRFIEYKQTDYTNGKIYRAVSQFKTIKEAGCMPTSLTIIASGYGKKSKNGQIYTPETFVLEVHNDTSNYDMAKKACKNIGLKMGPYTNLNSSTKSKVLKELQNGKQLLLHAASGYYTSCGHYMTALGVRNGDEVYLSNPSSRTKTGWIKIDTLMSRSVDWCATVSN